MSNGKNYQRDGMYLCAYTEFVGVDSTSDPRDVGRTRLSRCVNMYRDYKSQHGGCIETVPGYRLLATVPGTPSSKKINGIFEFPVGDTKYLLVHIGTGLYYQTLVNLKSGSALLPVNNDTGIGGSAVTLNNTSSQFYVFGNRAYLIDGRNYWIISLHTSQIIAKDARNNAYIPETYRNGARVEQRNLLTDTVKEVFTSVTATDDLSDYIDLTDSGYVTGFKSGYSCTAVYIKSTAAVTVKADAFTNNTDIKLLCIDAPSCTIIKGAFDGCTNLAIMYGSTALTGSITYKDSQGNASTPAEVFADCATGFKYRGGLVINSVHKSLTLHNPVKSVTSCVINGSECVSATNFTVIYNTQDGVKCIESIAHNGTIDEATVTAVCHSLKFTTESFATDALTYNSEHGFTYGYEAIIKCQICAVYDGRIFFTGNPALPNTVFYTQRNDAGANDPTYFGVYNYFNDGTGNSPNVNMLSTPSYLMVLKGDTVQDGSIYYHTGSDNSSGSDDVDNLIPRIYPSVSGSAGLGCIGETCNFLDDPIFISRLGVEGVAKQTVNLERTVAHRSSNIDRELCLEDLSDTSIAEWCGYMLICCNGNIYMADSRSVTQHQDGSYQYEWFKLEDIGTYASYTTRYKYCDSQYSLDSKPDGTHTYADLGYSLSDSSDYVGSDETVLVQTYQSGDDLMAVCYVQSGSDKLLVYPAEGGEKLGSGTFKGARKLCVIGDDLLFGDDNGKICIFNTDKRGVSAYNSEVESDQIHQSYYSFCSVAIRSYCLLAVDDCDYPQYSKCTVPNSTVIEYKAMPGSACTVRVSTDGVNWQELSPRGSSIFSFGDFDFENMSFGGRNNAIATYREVTRRYHTKQYYLESPGFAKPFGLKDLRYFFTLSGQNRY